ncbi:hypothetical protein [Nesterenkonia flava]|uniref:MFS transporter n=1 Tax=Nesterenkonia flava TaxID=469799 RepID=A0ABU1FQV2_9MICC|nr:hypothetical protein [Nesterenkonia flava]MDR5711014.1 hypothetical protein [Nesterenkonia flava]
MSRVLNDPSDHFRRLVYSLALSIGVSFGAILFGTSVLITSNAAGAEFSVSLLSSAFSGSILTGALLAVPVGRHADRHGVRGLTAWGGACVALGFLSLSLAHHMPLRAVVMSDWFAGPRFGVLMGIQAVGIALGRAAGPASVGWLADSRWGYPGGMLVLSSILILGFLAMLMAISRRNSSGG